MKRFTFLAICQGLTTVTQYCANSLNAAMHLWADGPMPEGIGPKAVEQLHHDIDHPLWQPNAYMEMPNVWENSFWVNRRELQCHMIETVAEADPDCPINVARYADGYYTIEQLHAINQRIDHDQQRLDWAAMKRHLQQPIADYPKEYFHLLRLAEACFMLNEHALALFDNLRYEDTIAACDKIIDMDFRYLAHGQYSDGADEARHYRYDCMAMKGLSLLHIGHNQEGRTLVETYLLKAVSYLSHHKKPFIRQQLSQLLSTTTENTQT